MPEAKDWMSVQPSANGGGSIGPKMLGPMFLDPNYGIVFIDQTDGTFWSLVVVSGTMQLQQVTL